MAHVQDGEVLLPESGSITGVQDELLLDHDDLLFNRTNSRDLVGKVGIFRGTRTDNVAFASYLVRMTASAAYSPSFLNYLLNSAPILGLARSMAMLSINQANLNPTRYTQIAVPVPPRSEQEKIVRHLDAAGGKIIALLAKVREAIGELHELRSALIFSAVTGKIDVREEAA
jgi:type I restriction enzyme S subunit